MDGNGGIDTANLDDSAGNDLLNAGPTQARLTGTLPSAVPFVLQVDNFRIVNANSVNGGSDTANFTDSAGADAFVGRPTISTMDGQLFSNRAIGFDTVNATADQGGVDSALFIGAPGVNDVFTGRQTVSSMTDGSTYSIAAAMFETATARGQFSDMDEAKLFDTAGANQFIARVLGPASNDAFMRLPNGSAYVRARNFARIVGTASQTVDTALLEGSTGDDSFIARPGSAQLTGPGFSFETIGFNTVNGRAATGNDTARLFDNAFNNSVAARPRLVQLTGGGLNFIAENFDTAIATASGGMDSAIAFDGVGADVFSAAEGLASLSGPTSNAPGSPRYDNRFENFERVEARATAGGSDSANFAGTAGVDEYVARPDVAQMTASTYFAEARNFETTVANVGPIGNANGEDRAFMFDSVGNDQYFGRTIRGILSGSNFSNSIFGFDIVSIFGNAGGTNTLNVANLSYVFNQFGTWV